MKTYQSILFVVLVVAIIASIYFLYLKPGEIAINNGDRISTTTDNSNNLSTSTTNTDTTRVKLYLRDESRYNLDCGAVREVEREITRTPRVADATLKLLFQEELKELISSYRSVSISDGVARVDFTPQALTYLNSAACMQASFKAPIEATLKQFPTVKSVEYSINGTVFREWDA